jgi:long-subunit acyl-CoA synthetase (AMP-forming)
VALVAPAEAPMTRYENLLEWAYHWERTRPNDLFLTQPLGGGDANVRDYTFAQVMDEARRMASHLQSRGLPLGSHIAIWSKNCAHWIMADLAIWMAGHVSVPVFPVLTAETIRYTLEHSESKLLFVGKLDPVWEQMKSGVPDGLPKIAFPLAPENDFSAWDEVIAAQEPIQDPVDRDPDETATVIYTSGSTGKPKGVMQSFRAMLATCEGIDRVFHLRTDDRYLSYLPMAHAMERWSGECVPLYCGERVFFSESLDTFVADLQRARPTLFLSVPRLWLKFQAAVFAKVPPKKLERLLKIPILNGIVKRRILSQLGLEKVRFAGSGSAPLPAGLLAWYRRLGLELLEGYGLSETFSYSHLTRPGHTRVGFTGPPYDDVECRLSEEGEVLVRGPSVMLGYLKMPEETRQVLDEDGWLRTGDRGVIDEEGRLKITGRTKELFKTSKGKYVAPAPIESMLAEHPRLELCCVSGAGQPQPFAVVQLAEGVRESADRETISRELRDHLAAVNEKLLRFERIKFITVVRDTWSPENGFLTPTLKVKRAKIEEAYGPVQEDWYRKEEPVVWQS